MIALKSFEFDAYQRWALTKAGDHPIIYWPVGLSGEAGELLDNVKKVEFHGHPLDREKIRKELGDVLFYTALTAIKFGFSLSDIAAGNVEKLNARYPKGFTRAASRARADVKSSAARKGVPPPCGVGRAIIRNPTRVLAGACMSIYEHARLECRQCIAHIDATHIDGGPNKYPARCEGKKKKGTKKAGKT